MIKSPLMHTFVLIIIFLGSCTSRSSEKQDSNSTTKPMTQLSALIIDGQNNHDVWPKSTIMMKQYLEETGLYNVEIARTAFTWKGKKYLNQFPIPNASNVTDLTEPQADPNYQPDFSKYDVVISNFGWKAAPWPEVTKKALEKYVSSGGGLVIIHAANNSFPKWSEFNKMIGLGGWGGRTEQDGPYVYYDNNENLVRDTSVGSCGHHGPQHEFVVQIRDKNHPITKGMPTQWLHTKDELYDRLRGPAVKMNILATAYAAEEQDGTARHEPMIFTIDYGKGKIFHTPMGHEDYSFECVGFITTFKRGTEWAATGKVTQLQIPVDFPSAQKSSSRSFVLKK